MENLIVADENGKELRVLLFDTYDFEVGHDSNDFQVVIKREEYEKIPAKARIYIPGTELGGLFRQLETNTEQGIICPGGITWRGMMTKKIIRPAVGADYATDSGELNAIIKARVEAEFPGLFIGVNESTGETVNWQYERYCTLESGLKKLLQSVGYRLDLQYSQADKAVVAQAVPIVDYSDSIEFSSDLRANYQMQQQGDGVNVEIDHILVLDLHKVDLDSRDSPLFVDIEDVFEIGVDPEIEVSIGDIVGGRDYLSGMTMKAPVWSKIIKYSAGEISIEYKLEEDRMTVEEDNLSKSSIKTIEEIKLLEKQQLKVDKTDELIKEEVKE